MKGSLRADVQADGVDFYGAWYAIPLNDSAYLNRPFIAEGFASLDIRQYASFLFQRLTAGVIESGVGRESEFVRG